MTTAERLEQVIDLKIGLWLASAQVRNLRDGEIEESEVLGRIGSPPDVDILVLADVARRIGLDRVIDDQPQGRVIIFTNSLVEEFPLEFLDGWSSSAKDPSVSNDHRTSFVRLSNGTEVIVRHTSRPEVYRFLFLDLEHSISRARCDAGIFGREVVEAARRAIPARVDQVAHLVHQWGESPA